MSFWARLDHQYQNWGHHLCSVEGWARSLESLCLDTPKGLSWLASWLTVPSLPAFSHGPSNIILRYRPFAFSSLWLGASVGCRLAKHRPPSGVVTQYREKKSLGLTKDRKSTLSTDAGKAVEKGTCDQFLLLSNRSIACHVALSIEEEGLCSSSLKSFLPIV